MEAEWRALWQPMEIDSAKPREMRAWLQQYRDLLECTAALRKQRGDVGELERSVVRVRSELDQALRVVSEAGAGPAESFTQLLERGGRAAARIRETEQGRKSLQQEAASLRPKLKGYRARRCEAEAQLTGHRGEWAAADAEEDPAHSSSGSVT